MTNGCGEALPWNLLFLQTTVSLLSFKQPSGRWRWWKALFFRTRSVHLDSSPSTGCQRCSLLKLKGRLVWVLTFHASTQNEAQWQVFLPYGKIRETIWKMKKTPHWNQGSCAHYEGKISGLYPRHYPLHSVSYINLLMDNMIHGWLLLQSRSERKNSDLWPPAIIRNIRQCSWTNNK